MPSSEWSQTTKRFVIVGLVILLVAGVYVFRGIIPILALSMMLAYVLKPLVDYLDRRTKMPRVLAVAIVFVVLLFLVGIIPATVVPYAMDRIARLNLDLQQLVDDLGTLFAQPVVVFGFTFDLRDLVGDLQGSLQELVRSVATQTPNIVATIASSLLWTLSILIIAFYLILDAEKLRSALDSAAPPGHEDELRHLREEVSQVWSAFFRGQVVLSLVVGTLVWITMTAVGLPNAGLIALLAGVLEIIPTFGPVLASLTAILTALFRGSTYLPISNFWFAALVLGIFLVIHQIDNGYLAPRIMGRRLRLNPVVVFIGVLAGGMVLGILGIFLAAPAIATARVILAYTYAKLLGRQPYPPETKEEELYPGEIDAIFFDLDGTLIETDDEAVENLARRLGALKATFPRHDPEKLARRLLMAGETPATRVLGLLDRIGLDDDVLDLNGRLQAMRGIHRPLNFRPVEGAAEALRDLSQRYQLAIVTTRSHREADTFLAQQELADAIEVVVGRDDTWRIKPHPSPVRHAAEQLDVPLERCLMVGDTTVDIEAARSAGARSAGVLCGFGGRDELENAGADLILQSTPELLDWL
jgi:HAD superfamily hydrolase (TIGR01549 family)